MLRSNKLLTCQSRHAFWVLIIFSSHLISSHRSFSWKLFIASHCHCSLCRPISSPLISRLLSFFHLISSHVFSPLLSPSQLVQTVLFSSHVARAFLVSFHLISAYLSFSQFSQLSQLFSAPRSSCQLILCLLISSLLFSHLLSSSHVSSADLSSCQLVSPHLSSSQRTLKSSQLFSGPKPAPNKDLGVKESDPYAFHREDLTQRTFTHSKLLHKEACTHRKTFTQKQGSFYTGTGKLVHRDGEAFTHYKLSHRASSLHRASLYTQKLLHTEALHRDAFTQRNLFYTVKILHTAGFYTQKLLHQLLHTASFHTKKPLHRKVCTQRSFYTQQDFIYRSFYRSFYTAFTHSKPPHREAPTQNSFYTEKLLHTAMLLHTENLCTQQALTQRFFLHTVSFYREAFTQRSLYPEKLLILNTETSIHSKLLHREALTQKLLLTEAFTHSKLLHREGFR